MPVIILPPIPQMSDQGKGQIREYKELRKHHI